MVYIFKNFTVKKLKQKLNEYKAWEIRKESTQKWKLMGTWTW